MKVWRVHELGEPATVLQLDDIADLDRPGPTSCVIDVSACALNFADDLLCRGTYQECPPLPFTPGLEVAGVVREAGEESRWERGTRVLAATTLPFGGLAEQCVAADSDMFVVPDDMDDPTAAALLVTYQTAWVALHRRARVSAGETLVVHAGAGGVGSAAIELGRAAGLHVLAVAGGEPKVARCLDLGANEAFDHRRGGIAEWVLEHTDGRGADVIFDPVGGDTFDASTRCIGWEGRILVIGAASGRYATTRTNHLLVKNYGVLGVHWGGYRSRQPEVLAEAHEALVTLWARKSIHPAPTTIAPLDDAPELLGRLSTGGTTGKLVLVP